MLFRSASRTSKIPKILSFFHGPQKHLDYPGATCSGIRALRVPFQVKLTKIPQVNPGLTESQSQSKSSQNKIFHVSTSNPELLSDFCQFRACLTKVDSMLTFKGIKKSNFDPIIKMGWDQHHCEYYQIPFPKTIHGSKSELKQSRYLENHAKRVSMLPEAITFYSTV